MKEMCTVQGRKSAKEKKFMPKRIILSFSGKFADHTVTLLPQLEKKYF